MKVRSWSGPFLLEHLRARSNAVHLASPCVSAIVQYYVQNARSALFCKCLEKQCCHA